MNTVQVRNLTIGAGIPKVCVPIAGRNREELLLRVEELKAVGADLAEWRADWCQDIFKEGEMERLLGLLREELGDLPLLFTFRTAKEGGEQEISPAEYEELLRSVIASGLADLIDVELFMGEELLGRLAAAAHRAGVFVVASSHDFKRTPEETEILRRLCRMQELGADLLKLAAMPESEGDVLRLLSATLKMKETYAKQPVVTMSMGKLGVISRLAGELFGSSLTFGSAGVASAPGQIGAADLRTVLGILHKCERQRIQ